MNAPAPQIAMLKLSSIRESPLNPRKSFDAKKLEELTESVLKVGVLQPVTVRTKHSGIKDGYELVYGHRRFRAALAAGLETIPAIVRELDDQEALEAMVIENGQREDVPPLEEAEGYQALLDRAGYAVADIAAKVGKSEALIYQRLKLLDLPAIARATLEKGELALSVALAIARIPDAKARAAAAKEVCTPREEWEYEDGKQRRVKELVSTSEALHLIRNHNLRFEDCGFSLEDAQLVPSAGACTSCPKRTKNSPMLFPDLERQDRCSDPSCFAAKKAASFEQRRRLAELAGVRVLNEKELKKVFPYGSGQVSSSAPYVDPKERCWEDPKGRTYAQLLGKELPEKVLAIDEKSGVAIDLVDKSQLMAQLKKVRPELGKSVSPARSDEDAEKRRKLKLKAQVAQTAIEHLVKHAELEDGQGQLFWDLLAGGIIRETNNDAHRAIAKRRGIVPKGQYPNFQRALETLAAGMQASQLRGLIVELLVSGDGAPTSTWNLEYGRTLRNACELYAVDLKKLERELASEKKAPKAKGKKNASAEATP